MTPADEADTVEEPVVPTYHAVYEAEDAQTTGAVYHSSSGGYYASGRAYLRNFPENATLTYTIDVPVDGRYRLDFIYGNEMCIRDRCPAEPLQQRRWKAAS